MYDIISRTENHAFGVGTVDNLHFLPSLFYAEGIGTHSILASEPHRLGQKAYCFFGQRPYFDIFSKFINLHVQYGIIDKWGRDHNADLKNHAAGRTTYKQKLEDLGPQVLTMDHMEVAFMFSLFPLIFSFVAFLWELLVFWIQKRIEIRKQEKEYEKKFRKAIKLNKKLAKLALKKELESLRRDSENIKDFTFN